MIGQGAVIDVEPPRSPYSKRRRVTRYGIEMDTVDFEHELVNPHPHRKRQAEERRASSVAEGAT